MADEPTNGELARRLDDLSRTQQGLVGQPQYLADQRRDDDRIYDLRRAVDEERRDRETAIQGVQQRITEELKTQDTNRLSWRSILYTGLIPALVALVAILVQIWLHGGSK